MFDNFMMDVEISTDDLIKECNELLAVRHTKLIEKHSGGDEEVKRQLISLYTSNIPKIGRVDYVTSNVETAGLFDKKKRDTTDDLKDIYRGVKSNNLKKAGEIVRRRENDVGFQLKAKNIIEDAKRGRKFQYNPKNYQH